MRRPPESRARPNNGAKSTVPPATAKLVLDGLLARQNQSQLARDFNITRSQVRSIAEAHCIITRRPSVRKKTDPVLPRYYPEGTGAKWRRSPT